MKKLFLAFAAVAMVFATSCNNENLVGEEPTPPDNSSDVTHEYVDLGLSVKWATCNVGAGNPWEHGYYLAWGETSTKEIYSYVNYLHYSALPYGPWYEYKYNGSDGKTVLESVDDAATVNWGGNWRMPTVAEFAELYQNCNWTWVPDNNGVSGYIIYGKKPGYTDKSIFLPAAGRKEDRILVSSNVVGCYWSSIRCNHTNTAPYGVGKNETGGLYLQAWYLYFSRSATPEMRCTDRYQGLSVRPVCP